MNLIEAAAKFAAMAALYEAGVQDALEDGCKIVEKEAKRVIGTYDYGWPQLAQSTQEDRVRSGFSANEPLLRTGEMRDTVEHTVQGHSGFVGSNDDKAVWQELGTSRGIPPRSFLGGAAAHKGAEVAEKIGEVVVKKIVGG